MALKRFIVAEFERKAQAVMTVDIIGTRIVEGEPVEYGKVAGMEILMKKQSRKGGYTLGVNGEPLISESRLSRSDPQKSVVFDMTSRKLTTDPDVIGPTRLAKIEFGWSGKQ